MTSKETFTRKYRDKIAQEAIDSGSQKVTALKYDLPVRRVYGWVKAYRDRDLQVDKKTTKVRQQELEDLRLEVQVLKELLKKTTQALIKD